MSTQTDIENLVSNLNLSSYQAVEIYRNREQYNMSRLQMRSGVLCVPRVCSVFARICGNSTADVIGRKRTFLRGAKSVKLLSGGYHTGKIGKSVFYGTQDGRAISASEFKNVKK